MEPELKVTKNNLHLCNSKVLKLKHQQEITKNYLAINIKNLQITKESLEKLEPFMAELESNPEFIKQIMAQLKKEQEQSNSGVSAGGLILSHLSFAMPNLKILSRNANFSFLYKLFDMVNDPNTNSVIIWSKCGTSFFIKDEEGLHEHVQERFSHSIKTFYKTLGDFGFQCVDKFLQEYTNENFQRDNKHKLKNITSKRKLSAVKKKMQSDMEEELKRLGFFQNELKLNIANTKQKEQITKLDLWHVKRLVESASKLIAQKTKEQRIAGLPHENFADTKGGRRPWLDSVANIGKLKHDFSKLKIQILYLEQGHVLVKNHLDIIEEILLITQRKQKYIELCLSNKLLKNPNVTPNGKGKRETLDSKIAKHIMNGNDHRKKEEESQEASNRMENEIDLEHKDLMVIGILEGELTFSW